MIRMWIWQTQAALVLCSHGAGVYGETAARRKESAAGAAQKGGSSQGEAAKGTGESSPADRQSTFLVDGYNIIFAWDELKELSEVNIDSARDKLLDILVIIREAVESK